MEFTIGNKNIGGEHPVFIIAELSANHGGNIENAIKTIEAAKEAGADAIKLQTYTADTITLDCKNEYFKLDHGTIWDGQYLYDLYKQAYTPWEWHEQLFNVAKKNGLVCFSSPFDYTAVDFLEQLDCPAYKVASFEIMDTPLISHMASTGKPIIISTGVADLDDIHLALEACRSQENDNVSLLKCTSSYPAPIEAANLLTIPDFDSRFNVVPGLSDHTLGITVPIVATSLGAKVIEKHFILDKSIGGPDASFSLDTKSFRQMVQAIREAESAMGKPSYTLTEQIRKNRSNTSRSLFFVEDIKMGEQLTPQNVKSIRPGFGLPPKYFKEVIGKTAKKDIKKGSPVSWDLFN